MGIEPRVTDTASMARDARRSMVRGAALLAAVSVLLGTVAAYLWRDDLSRASVRPLWDGATADARILLSMDSPLVLVIGGVAGAIVVALSAWQRERVRPPRPDALRSSRVAGEPPPHPTGVDVVRHGGGIGLLYAAVAALGATFGLFGAVESIWGAPGLRLSLLTFGGAAVVVAVASGPSLAVGARAAAVVDGLALRHAARLLLATLVLYGLTVSSIDRADGLSLGDAVDRLRGDRPTEQASPGVRRYYADLIGSELAADGVDIVYTAEFGLLIVAVRDGGFGDAGAADLQSVAELFGLGDAAAMVHRGVGVIVVGRTSGLESIGGDDHRERIRALLDG